MADRQVWKFCFAILSRGLTHASSVACVVRGTARLLLTASESRISCESLIYVLIVTDDAGELDKGVAKSIEFCGNYSRGVGRKWASSLHQYGQLTTRNL